MLNAAQYLTMDIKIPFLLISTWISIAYCSTVPNYHACLDPVAVALPYCDVNFSNFTFSLTKTHPQSNYFENSTLCLMKLEFPI